MSERCPQCGQTNVLMFSTRPSTGTFTRRNMFSPLRASISAKSCGVEAITAPASGTARGRRGVDAERLELAPGDLLQHLRERRHPHRPAPDHRRLLVDQKAHGHHLESISLHGLKLVADGLLRLGFKAQ